MFCKWCGAEALEEEATQCPRCGKSFSAKSDCGGFYDLVNVTKKTEAPPQTLTPAAPIVVEEPRRGFFPIGYDLFAVMASCAVVALLVLSIVLLVQVGGLGNKIEENAQSIANLDSQETDKEQPQETPEQEQPDREEDKGSFSVWFESTGLQAIAPSQDFKIFATVGAEDKTGMTVCVGPRQETMLYAQTLQKGQLGDMLRFEDGCLSGMDISLGGDGADLAISLTNQPVEDWKNRGRITVRVEALNEAIFGTPAGDLEFHWQRWNSEKNAWDDLVPLYCVQDPVETEDGAPAVGLRYNAGKIQEPIKLQLTITGKNTTDGSLTVVIDGITITQEMLDAVKTEGNTSAEQTAAE